MNIQLGIIHKTRLAWIVEYVFLLLIILNGRSIWTYIEDSKANKIIRILFVLVAGVYVLLLRKISFKQVGKMAMMLLSVMCFFLIYLGVVDYNAKSLLSLLICYIALYVFVLYACYYQRGVELLYEFSNLIFIIAIISLFFWLFGSVLNIIQPTGYVMSTWTNSGDAKLVPSYFSVYFETQSSDGVVRNTAIFTEAPMCSFQFCMGFFIELFCKKKPSKLKCIFFIIAVLTTLSTTGWCMLIVGLFLKFILSTDKRGKKKIIIYTVIAVILIVAIIVISNLVSAKLDSSSGSTRLDDFVAGFKAWITHPLFGCGYGNNEYIQKFMSWFRWNNIGFSNSPTQILAQGGIFFAIPYLYCIVRWIYTCIRSKNWQWLAFFACFLAMFTITLVSYTYLTFFVLFSYEILAENEVIESCEKTALPSNKAVTL